MIEVVLGSGLRVRVILALWKYGELHTTELAHRLGTNYRLLMRHIGVLSRYGVVEERRIGRLRLVKLSNKAHVIELAKALAKMEEYLEATYRGATL